MYISTDVNAKLWFVLAAVSVGKLAGGGVVYDKLQCQTDTFTVTSPGNHAPPVICGTNSGEHSKTIWQLVN